MYINNTTGAIKMRDLHIGHQWGIMNEVISDVFADISKADRL